MDAATRSLVSQARDILNGQDAGAAGLFTLAKKLKDKSAFGYARRLLEVARGKPEVEQDAKLRLEFGQQHSLCTYKDPDLPARERLDQALAILAGVDDLATTKNTETLGQAGAIHKRRWEIDGQRVHLERALAFYRRGYDVFRTEGPGQDQGYTAINAAFLLDLLAKVEESELSSAGQPSATAATRRAEACAIRENVAAKLPPLLKQPGFDWLEKKWWYYSTVAEAFFGLGRYDEALAQLQLGQEKAGPIASWEHASTVQQFATLARVQSPAGAAAPAEDSPAWRMLEKFVGKNTAALRTAFLGKVGLALSGGGFRASLYHIGVLARLAELDMLRHVEVLSCVSGGSIIGAQYYLEVRHLMQTKGDGDITRDDYVKIVRKIAKEFLEGVQKNIRTRVAASFLDNLKMIVAPRTHSRSLRAGQLYEQLIFARADGQKPGGDIWLGELLIKPAGEPDNFAPKQENWRRQSKVPILVLNATPLNTGHNWQFTATWMGEPPANIDVQIDNNERLRRMYYAIDGGTPPPERRVRLGQAVAASACVPGLFDPINLAELYPERTVRLVDGGVHDNQGVVSLLEQDCTVLLVSDASGQMNVEPNPCQGALTSLLRSNSILQARVRESEFHDLNARRRAGLLRGLMFIHLKKNLDQVVKDWVRCEDPLEEQVAKGANAKPLTPYGLRKDIQLLLAGVRTDLDSFCDLEAHALMTSGYRMTEQEFAQSIRGFPLSSAPTASWEFLAVEPAMKNEADPGYPKLKQLLEVASGRAFKVWKLYASLRVLGVVLGLLALAAVVLLFWNRRADSLLTVGGVGAILGGAVLLAVLGKALLERVRIGEVIARIVLGIFTSTIGWVAARLHLHLFDKLYLKWGRAKR